MTNSVIDWVAYSLESPYDVVATSTKLEDLLDLYSNSYGICSYDNYRAMLLEEALNDTSN